MDAADRTAPPHGPSGDEPTVVSPPEDRAATALVPDYAALYAHAAGDPERFWGEIAREIEWETNPTQILAREGATPRWFVGGRGNLTVNCLDRHLHESRRDKLALVWLGRDGRERRFTYAEFARLVCKFASGLKELGLGAGERIVLLLPPSPESVAAILACARLGAIASPALVSAGAAGLHAQLAATGVSAIIAADVEHGRDGAQALKGLVERTLVGLATSPRVIVWRRAGRAEGAPGVGEIDLADLLRGASPRCEPTIVDSDHPFFILPPTGPDDNSGGARGAWFSHGGYAVGAAYTTRIAYDLKDEDVYCPLGDADWFAAHPAALLGPLLNGATIVLHEGIPDSGTVWRTVARLGVTILLATSPTLRLLLGEGTPPAAKPTALRLLICDGPPLDTAGWWRAYRDILRGQGQLCANWWEPAMGAPTIGTLPSMDAKPGWLGKPLPGIGATVVDREGREVRPLVPGWLHLDGISPQRAQRDESAVAPPPVTAMRDEDGYITLLGES